MYSLNLTTDELAPQDGLGEECEVKECSISSSSSGSNSAITPSSDECNPTPGCRSFVLLIKVWIRTPLDSSILVYLLHECMIGQYRNNMYVFLLPSYVRARF